MQLPNELITEFVKATKDETKPSDDSVLYGTAKVEAGGSVYVTIDGSTELTPVTKAATVNDGERVMVTIKDHTATIVGNLSSPAARSGDVENLGAQIGEFNLVITDKVSTSELAAQVARINDLVADNITIKGSLGAQKAVIDTLDTTYATIENLKATNTEITNLKADKIDADVVEATYATIENLKSTNAEIENLKADKIDADVVEANYATIEKLQAEYATITSLENKYANIDFSNIGMLAVKELFAQSGLIKDLVVGDQTITGELVGVTIKGDLIEGNTIKADKLVVKGTDGIYYKLNFENGTFKDGETVPTDSLHGSIITAKSVTAEKVSVSDLVAFGATIGGFHITNNSIYSGVKETVGNTTRGIYIDNDGQIALGDSANYLKFYKGTDGKYKLDISAASLTFGDNSTSMEQFQKDTIVSTVEEFYKSASATALSGGSWSTNQPTWENGKFIWRRTKVTYGDGHSEYTPGQNGVCITGNTGATGAQGPQGIQGETGAAGANGTNGVSVTSVDVYYYRSTSNTGLVGGSWSTKAPDWVDGTYMWTKTVVTYSSGNPSESTPVCITGAKGSTGATGAAGSNGTNGTNGVGVKSIVEQYYQSTSATTLSGGSWSPTYPGWVDGRYIWTKSVITYTNNESVDTTPICVSGSKGATGQKGDTGDKGDKGDTGAAGKGIKSIANKYAVSTSNTNAPTTWYDSVQQMTATNKYLWNYEIVTFTDDTTSPTDKRVIGVYGDKGADGTNGRGISSITEYYLATSANSGVTTSTSGWTKTIQATDTTKKYLWNYEVITYTSGSPYTSTPVIIGTHGATGAQGSKGDKGDTGEQGPQGDKGDTGPKGDDGQMLYATCGTAAGTKEKIAKLSSGTLTLKEGATVAVKFTYANTASSPSLNVAGTGAKSIRLNGSELSTVCDYWSAGASVTFVYDGSNWNITSVSDASKTASNFMYVDSTNGLQIGDRRTGSWAGYHTQVTNDSFNVLDKSDTILASYGADEILLGANSIDSTIKFCGDKATIRYDNNDGYTYLISESINAAGTNSAMLQAHREYQSSNNVDMVNFAYVKALASDDKPKIVLEATRFEQNSDGDSTGTTPITLLYLDDNSVSIDASDHIHLTAPEVQVFGQLGVTKDIGVGGNVEIDGALTARNGYSTLSCIELYRATPFVDFHSNNSTEDYTHRIEANGTSLNVIDNSGGGISFKSVNGITLKTVGDIKSASSIRLFPQSSSNFVVALSDRFRSNGNDVHYLGDASNKWKDIYSVKSSINTSDRNLKKNIVSIDDRYVSLFDKLQPVSYEFKSPTSDRTHLGFISQDVKESMDEVGLIDLDFAAYCRDVKMETVKVEDPETGETTEIEREVLDENGDPVYLYSLRYSEFIALNTKMIQLNKQKIAEQEQEIESLRSEVSNLRKTVEKLLANQ